MTGQTAEREMLAIAEKIRSDIQENLSRLDSRQTTAQKAYKISLAMVNHAIDFVTMKFTDRSHDEKYYSVREKRVFFNVIPTDSISYFAGMKDWYDGECDRGWKEAFLVYAFAVQDIHSYFLDRKIEKLSEAGSSSSAEQIFEMKMSIDTLTEILDKWESWWREAGGAEHVKGN